VVAFQDFFQDFGGNAFFIGEGAAGNGAHHKKREGDDNEKRQKAGPYSLKDVLPHSVKPPQTAQA
jgi:hypothetical protein